ncbi:MAG: hypothetical protein WCF06_08715 [Nitrososphaeraceae archaeon]
MALYNTNPISSEEGVVNFENSLGKIPAGILVPVPIILTTIASSFVFTLAVIVTLSSFVNFTAFLCR